MPTTSTAGITARRSSGLPFFSGWGKDLVWSKDGAKWEDCWDGGKKV